MRQLFRLPLLTLAVVLAFLASILAVAPAQAAGGDVKIVDANLGSGPSDTAVGIVDAQQADVVTFQEICASEFFRWKNQYGWEGQFTRMTENFENVGSNRCGDQEKGQAILHRPAFSSTVQRLTLPSGPGGKEFTLMCLDIAGIITDDLHVCTTHLWQSHADTKDVPGMDDSIRASQINKAMDWLGPWATWGRRVVFTGDLNTNPSTGALTQVYDKYREASGLRAVTETDHTVPGRKIDYIFGDRPVSSSALSLFTNPHGDGHKILRGRITF